MVFPAPYLSESDIERDAELLLAEFTRAKGIALRAPIPIEDIIEKYLNLHVEFDDLHRRLNVPRAGTNSASDVFGAIWFDSGTIVIHESLDPEVLPRVEGRYRFTLAHEGGHWRLHRALARPDADQQPLFTDAISPTVVCRSSRAKERVEWQADYFASCLLMPRELLFDAWTERFGNANPRRQRKLFTADLERLDAARRESLLQASKPFDDQALEQFAAPLAAQFLVSRQAMRIRLEKLGLLLRGWPAAQSRLAV